MDFFQTTCQITHPKLVSYAPYLSNSALPTLNLFESAGPKNANNKETDEVLGMDSNEDGKMRVKVRTRLLEYVCATC